MILVAGVEAQADEAKVTCTIKNLASATKCMQREAKAQQAYEEPNDALGYRDEYKTKIAAADYVADLSYPEAYDRQPFPSADLFFIGADGTDIDVYGEIESALEMASEQ